MLYGPLRRKTPPPLVALCAASKAGKSHPYISVFQESRPHRECNVFFLGIQHIFLQIPRTASQFSNILSFFSCLKMCTYVNL